MLGEALGVPHTSVDEPCEQQAGSHIAENRREREDP
jgi:hypothetical protein